MAKPRTDFSIPISSLFLQLNDTAGFGRNYSLNRKFNGLCMGKPLFSRKVMKKLTLVALAAIVLLPPAVWAQGRPQAQQAPQVIVASVTQREFSDTVEALGTTRANETVRITANVTEIVTEIHFEDGQHVKKGDVLIVLDKSEEEADLKAAKAQLTERKSAYDRARGLESQQALSRATLQERQAALRQVEGEIAAIEARIGDRTIRAPFDGVLGLRNVSLGALVRPGDLVTTIDDLSQIKVDFDVPSLFLNDLRPGLEITGHVEAFGDRSFSGQVNTVGTQVDPVTRTVTVRAVLPNPDETLKPGLLMTIGLHKNVRQAIVVPEAALVQRDSRVLVLVVEEAEGKTVARMREIRIGSRIPGAAEVTAGLAEGDRVVTHGAEGLSDGQAVVIRGEQKPGQPLQELLGGRKKE